MENGSMGIWHRIGHHLAEEDTQLDGVSAAALAGSFAAALGVRAALATYEDESWALVDPSIQTVFQEAHEELTLLRLSLVGKAGEETQGTDPVRALTLPLSVAELCQSVLNQLQPVATCGARAMLADIGTAATLSLAALDGALLHVREHLEVVPDEAGRTEWMAQAERMWERGSELREEIMAALLIRMAS